MIHIELFIKQLKGLPKKEALNKVRGVKSAIKRRNNSGKVDLTKLERFEKKLRRSKKRKVHEFNLTLNLEGEIG